MNLPRFHRRQLLEMLSALAVTPLVGARGAFAQVRSPLAAPALKKAEPANSIYLGNPNINISSVDTTGGISMPRTSGQVPFFVHVSASAITAAGTNLPWEDLMFSWNFGDALGKETFTRPTDGAIVNANGDQVGPEAAYVYRLAGTYTITLTITGKNGNAFTTTTVKTTVKASAFDVSGGEYWFDSIGGNDANPGTLISPKKTLSAMNALITHLRPNTAIHVKRGSTYNGGTAPLNIFNGQTVSDSSVAGLRIDAYGSGANPTFVSTTAGQPALVMVNGGSSSGKSKSDVVLSNLSFSTAGLQTGNQILISCGSNPRAQFSHVYLDNCDVSGPNDSAGTVFQIAMDGTPAALFANGSGLWNCTLSGPASAANGSNSGFYGGARRWGFVVGGSISGATKVGGLECHHIYPEIQEHSLYKWINFSVVAANPRRSYCINTNWNSVSGGLEYCQWVCMSECNFSGTQRAHDAGQSSAAFGTFLNGSTDITISVPFQNSQPTPGMQLLLAYTPKAISALPTGVPYYIASVSGAPTVKSLQVSTTLAALSIAAGSNGAGSTPILSTLFKNFVAERCAYNNLAADALIAPDVAQTMTVRDARVWACNGGRWFGMNGQLSNLNQYKLYRNKIYVASTASASGAQIDMGYNGLFLAQQITDNIIQSSQSNAQLVALPFMSLPVGGSIVDRNTYYGPSDSDAKFLFDGSTAKSFAQWQARLFDMNGAIARPSWITPPTRWSDMN